MADPLVRIFQAAVLVLAVASGSAPRVFAQTVQPSFCVPSSPLTATNEWLREHLRSLAGRIATTEMHIAAKFFSEGDAPLGETLADEYQAFFWPFYGSMIKDVDGIGVLGYWVVSDSTEAYLLRVPSAYAEATQVWLYQRDRCVWDVGPVTSVAEIDGSFADRVDSWIIDWDQDGHPDLVQRHKTWELDATPDVEIRLAQDSVTVYYWHPQLKYYAETYVADPEPLRSRFDFESPRF